MVSCGGSVCLCVMYMIPAVPTPRLSRIYDDESPIRLGAAVVYGNGWSDWWNICGRYCASIAFVNNYSYFIRVLNFVPFAVNIFVRNILHCANKEPKVNKGVKITALFFNYYDIKKSHAKTQSNMNNTQLTSRLVHYWRGRPTDGRYTLGSGVTSSPVESVKTQG